MPTFDACASPTTNECVTLCFGLREFPCKTCLSVRPSGYECRCPSEYVGDARLNGTGCWLPRTNNKGKDGFFGLKSAVVLVFLIIGLAAWLSWILVMRRRNRVREMFYRQNGGRELEGILAREVKEFTPEEVKSATAGWSESRFLGEGGQGKVYHGTLAGGVSVAVKVAKAVDDVQLKEFLRELAILSQLNHKNVVKLLGYCLRLEQPALIYELLSNGNLFEKLRETPALSWDARMTIVIDVASAIEYLHSEMDKMVFHKDIKSANVLLDQNMVAKLSDFGLSRVVPGNQSEVKTKVMGTYGYIDRQFREFGNYSKECDLFSFGIILAEILTGQKPYEKQRVGEGELGQYFELMHKDPAFLSIIDKEVLKSARLDVILAMADLTLKCLDNDWKRRPTIGDVKSELSRLLEVQRFGPSRSSWTN